MEPIQRYDDLPARLLREKVIDRLKENYAHNNLELEEFEKRLDLAVHSQSRAELQSLVKDLPEIDVSREASPQAETNYALNKGYVKGSQTFLAIFSGCDKKGSWAPAKNIHSVSIFGGITLDFTQAQFPPGVTYINAVGIFGGIDIIVPEGINVDTHGVGIFGGFDDHTDNVHNPAAPMIIIRGAAIFGGVTARTRKR